MSNSKQIRPLDDIVLRQGRCRMLYTGAKVLMNVGFLITGVSSSRKGVSNCKRHRAISAIVATTR